jgi:hypothetical protein
MNLTIAFITGRSVPRLDWMLESLVPQLMPTDQIHVLVIDMQGRSPEQLCGNTRLPKNVHVQVTLPKPTAWQGTHRVTTCDWWAKASAMNTAFVRCETEYIAFVDDCCYLGSRWLEMVRQGSIERCSVLAGAFIKTGRDVTVKDHRLLLEPVGKLNCGGGWLYGCTFAVPLEWALEVNGAEEGCDGMGAEDYTFGLQLENNGHRIDFLSHMEVTQTRDEIFAPNISTSRLRRADKGTAPKDKSNAALARFGSRKRTEFSPNLRTLRALREAGTLTWPLPDPNQRDWYDQTLLRDLR